MGYLMSLSRYLDPYPVLFHGVSVPTSLGVGVSITHCGGGGVPAAKGLKTRLIEVGGQIFNPAFPPPQKNSPPSPSFPFYCMLMPKPGQV